MSINKPHVRVTPREENQDHISSVPRYKDDPHSVYEMPHLSHCKNTLKSMVTTLQLLLLIYPGLLHYAPKKVPRTSLVLV